MGVRRRPAIAYAARSDIVRGNSGSVLVIRSVDRRFVCLAVIGMLGAAFTLAGCGRKGALDPPPSASLAQPAAIEQPSVGEAAEPAFSGFVRAPQEQAVKPPPPAPPEKKSSFILDWLLK